MIVELNERSKDIFRFIVDSYLDSGEPVGSRTLSKMPGLNLSPASIRNVMSDLETAGLLYSPHTSAGRLPTQTGLRLYVDGLMEIGNLTEDERKRIESECRASGQSMHGIYDRAGSLLSGLSACAGLVVAPKAEKPIRTIQFVQLDARRVLTILVLQDGMVENRVMELASDVPPTALAIATNYLNDRLAGKTLSDSEKLVLAEIAEKRTQLDAITAELVRRGLALRPEGAPEGLIVVRGQSKMLNDVKAIEDLEKARHLLAALEEKETLAGLLVAAQSAEGVQIFIGTENRMFEHSGWSLVLSPYRNSDNRIIGAIGVIGPTRLNYGRIIPIVDYTSKVVEKLLGF